MTKMYTLKEACDILGISRQTALKYIQTGKLKAVKIGGAWKCTEAALNAIASKGVECASGSQGFKAVNAKRKAAKTASGDAVEA